MNPYPERLLGRVLVVATAAKSHVVDGRLAAARELGRVVELHLAPRPRSGGPVSPTNVHCPPSRFQTSRFTCAAMWRGSALLALVAERGRSHAPNRTRSIFAISSFTARS
jgi:hypothetical protein